MNEILLRIQHALAHHGVDEETVIYLGRCEWYDMLSSMRGATPVHFTYENEVLSYTCFGVKVIEVNVPKYLRVA